VPARNPNYNPPPIPPGVDFGSDTDWGTREFGFRDLDGNGLTFYRDL
jgi:hypothetical protein